MKLDSFRGFSVALALATICARGAAEDFVANKSSVATIEEDDTDMSRDLDVVISLSNGIDEDRDLVPIAEIVGGDPSERGEFPYFVDLGPCAGTLISPKIVLTAGHCNPESYAGDYVTVGAAKRSDKSIARKRIRVVEGKIHPGFQKNGFLNNDFGLLLLARPYVIKNDKVKLVLNDVNTHPTEGMMLTAIGMGATVFGGDVSPVLRDVTVPYITNDRCSMSYNGITKKMLCAGKRNGGMDACQGDSGGPLVRQMPEDNTHELVGVTSWGVNCAKYPGVYARVSQELHWIKKVACDEWGAGSNELCGRVDNYNVSPSTCGDDPSFSYKAPKQDCNWVGLRKRARCMMRKGQKRLKSHCRKTCGAC
jgi:trypsin